MSDEEVIRRRLIIDGDGTGDDRRLNILLKNLIKWANHTEAPAEEQQLYDRMLAQINQCEFAVRRSQLLAKTSDNQLSCYKDLQQKLEGQIQEVKGAIDLGKENLEKAKILKHNRMMYDMLAKSIKDEPARKETDKRLSDLKTELGSLEEQSKNYENKLDTRKKLFHVLISSANQLHGMLEDGREEENTNTSLDNIDNSPEPEAMVE